MKINRYIALTSDSPSLPRFRKDYINQHSKLIHSSWLLKEDLDRPVTLNDIDYTISGLWDSDGGKYMIMLKPVNGGSYYLADSKEVSIGLGYSRMRNLVTGAEHKWDLHGTLYVTAMPIISTVTDETNTDETGEDSNEEKEWAEISEEEEEYVDPLVKALLDDIIDEGDISAY